MSTLWQDLRYGARMLARNPGFTAVAVLTLALGIGANTAVFSFVKVILFPSMPMKESERVVLLWSRNPIRGLDRSPVSPADFADVKEWNTSLENLASVSYGSANLTGGTEPVRVGAGRTTSNFFSLLGVRPALGRTFLPEESVPGRDAVAVLSHETLQNHFGGNREIIGKTIHVDGDPHTVIGVMPPRFWFLSRETKIWVPLPETVQRGSRDQRRLIVVGRLKPSISAEQVGAEMEAISKRLAQDHPETNSDWEIGVTGVIPFRAQERVMMGLLVGVVLLVLGIACANVANLLLARAEGRKREIAVRMAMGATRLRVIRQLLAESMVFSLFGAAIGLLLAAWGTYFLRSWAGLRSPFVADWEVDTAALAFTLGVSVVSGVLFGLAPALRISCCNFNEALKEGVGRLTGSLRGMHLRRVFIVGELSIATVLLIIAGLMIRTLINYNAIELGFQTDRVVTFRIEAPRYKYPKLTQAATAHTDIVRSVSRTQGMEVAGAGIRVPTAGGRNNPTRTVTIQDRPNPSDRERDWAMDLTVTPGYFEALGIPLLRGRIFDSRDSAGSIPVALVSRTMARRYWQDESPIGKQLKLGNIESDTSWLTVVGLVGDVRNDDAGAPPVPQLYLPLSQNPARVMTYVVKTVGDPREAMGSVRSAVAQVDGDLPLFDVRTMEQVVENDLAGTGLLVAMLTGFAGIALLLAAVGTFGVVSYAVSQRTREFGIRMALGAGRREILRMVVGQGIRPALLGVGIGLTLGLILTRTLTSLLYGVSPTDLTTFVGVAVFLTGIAAAACYIPARRATKVDPMVALRYE